MESSLLRTDPLTRHEPVISPLPLNPALALAFVGRSKSRIKVKSKNREVHGKLSRVPHSCSPAHEPVTVPPHPVPIPQCGIKTTLSPAARRRGPLRGGVHGELSRVPNLCPRAHEPGTSGGAGAPAFARSYGRGNPPADGPVACSRGAARSGVRALPFPLQSPLGLWKA